MLRKEEADAAGDRGKMELASAKATVFLLSIASAEIVPSTKNR